jgi:hypothetical protein
MRLERIKQQDLLNIILSIFTVFTYVLLITRVSLLGCDMVRVRPAGPGPVRSLVRSGFTMSKTGPEARQVAKSPPRARQDCKTY